jgi:hypothetical protein
VTENMGQKEAMGLGSQVVGDLSEKVPTESLDRNPKKHCQVEDGQRPVPVETLVPL